MRQSVSEAKILIDNLAASDSMIQPSYDETIKAINIDPTELKEIKVMVSQILKNTMRPKAHEGVTAPQEDVDQDFVGDFSACDLREVSYIGSRYKNLGTRSHGPHYGPKELFYTHQNVPHETNIQPKQQFANGVQQTHSSDLQGVESREILEEDFEPLINGFHYELNKFRKEIHSRMDILGHDINNKIEEISSHVKQIDLQIAYIAGTIGKPDGFLPGLFEVNPRSEHVKAM
ncbi:unnamed protein product [Arabis nemorensis]|uniref:Uncharacterized protein n=1 Tax=Arabis nemorensis TaxID=586526 RepID=A0A565C537_9BRAS|nr:unnamed protein product [Arabis nemorensis]